MDDSAIGNLFIIGFEGGSLSSELRQLLDNLNPAGVILFSRNIQNPLQTLRLNNEIQAHALERDARGIFIGVDQEGGRVARLTSPFARFQPALQLASSPDPRSSVSGFAARTAQELRLAGFNLDFAPVLDVLSHRDDLSTTVIGDRSYGDDPWLVSTLANAVIDVFRSAGVIPCGKHFPGHGGTLVDSHHALPVDSRPLDKLRELDLIPFTAAVENRVEMLMTAHVVYTALDPARPATLSRAIIGELLRAQLNYQGVVVTDDLGMAAVSANHEIGELAVGALKAGADLLMICKSAEKALSAKAAVIEALNKGELDETPMAASLKRINDLKKAYEGSLAPSPEENLKDYFRVLGIEI
jgi:beta-N-acetylhexosaminidase